MKRTPNSHQRHDLYVKYQGRDSEISALPGECGYKPPQPEQPKGDPLEQIVKLEREMSQVQEKYKHAEENYGSELLNLVVAKGYLKKLMENDAIQSYVARHASEILEQFELVLSASYPTIPA